MVGVLILTVTAGIPLEKIAGSRTSVFAGCFSKDYHDLSMQDETILPSFLTGNGTAMFSNRVSHFFDLRGPSMSIDTGCSSSLNAVHLACKSLRDGEAGISIVGAANLILSPKMMVAMSSLGSVSFLSRIISDLELQRSFFTDTIQRSWRNWKKLFLGQ